MLQERYAITDEEFKIAFWIGTATTETTGG